VRPSEKEHGSMIHRQKIVVMREGRGLKVWERVKVFLCKSAYEARTTAQVRDMVQL
jgi:hypothetical protein